MALIKTEVSGQKILDLLKLGYVRYTNDKVEAKDAIPASEGVEAQDAVEASPGCIQEHFGLTRTKLAEFLQHPRLKNFRYTVPKPIVLVDDFVTILVDDFAPQETLVAETVSTEESVLDAILDNASAVESELFF